MELRFKGRFRLASLQGSGVQAWFVVALGLGLRFEFGLGG